MLCYAQAFRTMTRFWEKMIQCHLRFKWSWVLWSTERTMSKSNQRLLGRDHVPVFFRMFSIKNMATTRYIVYRWCSSLNWNTPVPLRPPRISAEFTWDWTLVSAVRSQCLVTLGMACRLHCTWHWHNWSRIYEIRWESVKAVPLHAMEEHGGRGGIAPTHS
jgi:hypothetical protein